LHELPCVGIQGFEVAPLSLGEQNVESQAALAAAGNAGDDREAIAGEVDVDVLEVVLPGPADFDDGGRRNPLRIAFSILDRATEASGMDQVQRERGMQCQLRLLQALPKVFFRSRGVGGKYSNRAIIDLPPPYSGASQKVCLSAVCPTARRMPLRDSAGLACAFNRQPLAEIPVRAALQRALGLAPMLMSGLSVVGNPATSCAQKSRRDFPNHLTMV
jgi:hypothetical protein